MRLTDIPTLDHEMLKPADIAPILGVTPYYINIAARDDPASLGFPVLRSGSHVKIPRRAFWRFMTGTEMPETVPAER